MQLAVDDLERADLIRLCAEHRLVPKQNPWREDEDGNSECRFERRGGYRVGSATPVFSDATRRAIVEQLGIDSECECERLREEIQEHPKWGWKG